MRYPQDLGLPRCASCRIARGRSTLQHALAVLADEGLIVVWQGRNAVVAGEPDGPDEHGRRL
jgi:DNA-binding GntR family transcriptional regulator